MNPIKRGQLEHHIEWAAVEFLDTGESIILATKPDSGCHFFPPFPVENDTVTLRLDWSDIDKNGNPTLDADFYNKNTHKKLFLKGERKDVHHTSSTGEGGRRYCWEFKDYKRPFKVMVSWLLVTPLPVEAKVSVSLEVTRSTDESSQ